MQTRDGVRLDADVYTPKPAVVGEGPWPVLMMRQPYGRAIASTIVYAHPSWYAERGYLVVIQDVRGRGTSEGEFDLFAHEVLDGVDAVRWAAQLPNSSGQVGMYGFSYQGMTQLQAAEGCARESVDSLSVIAPAMTGYHLYEDWAYENGALCFQLGLVWAIQLAAETARRKEDVETYQKLLTAARNLPLRDALPLQPNVLAKTDTFFHEWVANDKGGDYWQRLTPDLTNVDIPMLHIGGWFDPYLRGDMRRYEEMSARSQYLQPLCVGPWAHIPWGRKVGSVDFGAAAMSLVDQLQVEWFDYVLKGSDWMRASVQLFEMGQNVWRSFDAWPQSAEKTYFLWSDGLTNIRADSGLLTFSPSESKRVDTLVHDPWNPTPAVGGHSAIPSGSFERTAVDSRGDVLTYTSEPMEEALRVAGVVRLECAIAATVFSYDLCAVLSRVEGSQAARAYNLTQGYCRVERTHEDPANPRALTLSLHPTCFSLAAGECLRLSLSAACFPAYPVNTGTSLHPSKAQGIAAQIVTLTFDLGGSDGAKIVLPTVADWE